MEYRIEIIIGENHQWRGVAFLKSRDRKVTAKSAFDKLDRKSKQTLQTRFEYWQNRKNCNKYFHGWDKTEFNGRYTKCFVFKCCKSHHFYGFLCNPKDKNKIYQICILVKHVYKNEWETDETDLKHVEEIRNNLAVQRIIKDFFKEKL